MHVLLFKNTFAFLTDFIYFWEKGKIFQCSNCIEILGLNIAFYYKDIEKMLLCRMNILEKIILHINCHLEIQCMRIKVKQIMILHEFWFLNFFCKSLYRWYKKIIQLMFKKLLENYTPFWEQNVLLLWEKKLIGWENYPKKSLSFR